MRACLFLAVAGIAIPAQANSPAVPTGAPIAYLTDLHSGTILIDRQSRKQVPTASMAKMLTAYVAFDAMKAGKIDLGTEFTVRRPTWQRWQNRGSTMFLKDGQSVSVENLLHGILTLSGNDASVVLAEGISGSERNFVAEMNVTAAKLGMKASYFGNANGWPDGGKTHSTAHDLALLAERIIEDHPLMFEKFFAQRSFRWSNVSQANRNPLLGAIDGADGMKTGHSSEAGYCLTGTARRGNRRLVMVIAGLPTAQARIDEARRLMRWGFDNFQDRPLFALRQKVADLPVQLGTDMVVPVVTTQPITALQPVGTSAQPRITVIFNGPIMAPIKKGQAIAELSVEYRDGGARSFPLVAAEDVGRTGFLGRAWNGVRLMVQRL